MSNLKKISEDEKEDRSKLWTGPNTTMVNMVSCKDFYMPERFLEIKEEIESLEIRPDDLFSHQLSKGRIYLESRNESLVLRGPESTIKSVEAVKNKSSPRIIKSHLLTPFLPKDLFNKSKVIYIMRNPKDVCVSFYHHEKLLKNHQYTGSFDEYAELFIQGKVAYGSYWEHLKFGLEIQKLDNVLLLCYEDMKKDLIKEMKKVLDFMKWDELSEEKLEKLNEHLSFNQFQKKFEIDLESDNRNPNKVDKKGLFIRKGIVGDWKNYFSGELSDRFDEKTRNFFESEGLQIQYE
ncbi:SULT1E1 [Lepeophtheirus salmonis]|uniref:SULT1E1 n=1 Tax=Lepeophtheirus salmonis TaxID=72036 RepID=A0A7R8H2F8_LEPSM|nr:SULT1E1 [Lepeophtheirus salmonis]CAF2823821.1 SULT1E1 [Lepeophtheirus salmonis]